MNETYIVYAKRTPMGKIGGMLSNIRIDDLLSLVIKDFVDFSSFDLQEIDDVLIGCANQAGEDNRNLARMASILGGLPFDIPGTTINRLCASSLDAFLNAHARIKSGLAECILVGGAESMTRAPYVLSKSNKGYDRNQKIYDTSFGWRFPNPKMEKLFPLLGMGQTAEEIAKRFKISREEQDKFALESHKKAVLAYQNKQFNDEIVPVEIINKKSSQIMTKDECIREDTSMEALSKLRPVFKKDGSVTAGNSSPMNDGASLALVVSGNFLKTHQLRPMIKITGGAVRGVHPNTMGLGPISSTELLCKKTNQKIDNFDIIELNEAFAIQSLACIEKLNIDPKKVNLNGGAIALGHPLGSSGCRIMTTLTHQMSKNPKLKQGLATMCVGVGQGMSISVENCQ